MFFKNSVRSAVVKVINQRINIAEKGYQFSLKNLFAETKAKIQAIRDEQKIKQQNLLDEYVNSVLRPQ